MSQANTPRPARFALRWLAAAVVVGSLFGSGGVADASTARPTRLVVTADPMTVHVGATIVLSGTVTPRSATPVYLQRYVAGHWVNLGHHVTSATGAYKFTIKSPAKPTTWIFRVVRAAKASRTVHVKISSSSFLVKATTTAKVFAGRPLVVTGSVSPKGTGAVRLQILRGKTWTNLASATLTKKSTFTLSASRPAGAYRLRVLKPFTATIAAGVSATKSVAVVTGTVRQAPAPALSVSTPDDALLALAAPRLIFSTVQGQPLPPARSVTFTNSGSADATVSGLAITGPDASSYGLAAGQPTTLTVPAGATATVAVEFHPTAPTDCPTTSDPYGVSNSNRYAALTFTSNDPAVASGSAGLAGLVACGFGGANEPVLHQILQALGYTTVVDGPGIDPRFLGPDPFLPGTDEISAAHFRAADPALPVSVTPLAHYSSPSTTPYHATGWYAKGAALPTDGSCNAVCHQLFIFPADPSATTYNQNQKLMPATTGTTTFTTSDVFGLYTGDKSDVVFSDDALNASASPHDMRVYPAYGPGHVAIADTYLVAIDTGRGGGSSDSKNHDFQDVVEIVRNVVPTS